jgi:hypothetical protein
LLRGLAGFPGRIPVISPDTIVQVTDVRDVAEAASRALAPAAPTHFACDVLADERTTLGQILTDLRRWLGFVPARPIRVPTLIANVTARLADGLALLGWRSPMRTTALRQLAFGVEGRAADAADRLGFTPRRLSEILAAEPAGVQDRWFARLYFAKPLGLSVLIAFWAVSGVIGLQNSPAAIRLLLEAGFSPRMSEAFVIGGSVVDIALAGLACQRNTAPWALIGMVAVTAAYLAAACLWTPQLWLDPLGPLIKSIPAAVLALFVLGVMEER